MLGNSAIQRKKSLPDVAALPTVTVKQGSQAMTREEISVLSSARREEIRRQLEEAERYRANPVLYILNPHIRVSFTVLPSRECSKIAAVNLISPWQFQLHFLISYLAIDVFISLFFPHRLYLDLSMKTVNND